MARPSKGRLRVLGPYKHHKQWRIFLVGREGQKLVESFGTEKEAAKAASAARRSMPGRLNMESVLTLYEKHLKRKGNKTSSISRTMRRLRVLNDDERHVADVTQSQLVERYTKRSKEVFVDTHRNELNECKTFWRWCVRKKFVNRSPATEVEPVGRRNRGKPQLRRAEAQKFFQTALRKAQAGDESSLALMALLLMGLRSGEILQRVARDVDVLDDSVLLWIEHGKTRAATRHHEVPEPLASLLAKRIEGRKPDDWLFPADTATGYRRLEWFGSACKRVCRDAGVPLIPPHGLRGTWATLTTEAGVLSHVVARELGHTHQSITERHYMVPGAREGTKTKKMLKLYPS